MTTANYLLMRQCKHVQAGHVRPEVVHLTPARLSELLAEAERRQTTMARILVEAWGRE